MMLYDYQDLIKAAPLTMCRYDTCQQTTTSLMYSATTGDVTALRRLHGGGSDMGERYI